MRQYDVLYDRPSARYKLIAKDDTDDYWFTKLDSLPDRETAQELKEAYEAKERERYIQ